ncbi:MAG: zinc-dependent metalloprotease [Bacteroidota bacterium]
MLRIRYAAAIGLLFFSFLSSAQKGKNPSDTTKPKADKDEYKVKTIDELVKRSRKTPGLFTLYQDTLTGTTWLQVDKEQINKDYIYFCYSLDGVAGAGFRGEFLDNKVFTIRRYFNRIEFVTRNNGFYFDKSSPLSKAADANRSDGVLFSQVISGENSSKDKFLIKADDIFLNETMVQVKPAYVHAPPPGSFTLGSLSKEKTKYLNLKNYPKNTDVLVEYVYDNPGTASGAPMEVAERRYLSVRLQHSLIELPQNSYKPRIDDPRIGYFTTYQNDQTTPSVTPYHDLIHRWNLEKKDKNAAVSEPVNQIVFWMEKTTPYELRPIIRKAGLAWNEAFEKAGFRNAVDIKEQSDTATWDAGDLRYNVLRWTSSPSPGFGGFGPSFVNPLTGEIIGADIMLEYIFITNRMKMDRVFSKAGLFSELEIGGDLQDEASLSSCCTFGHHLHHSALLGQAALKARNATAAEVSALIENSVYYLILHEMGHTLGLNHNMKASQWRSPAELANKAAIPNGDITASVMDYPVVNISPTKANQGNYFTSKPGPYDLWAIEYGYSASLEDPAAEQARLNKILMRSTEPALAFGNDADDMRAPGKAIDPRVMIGDISSDAISYSADRMRMLNSLLGDLKSNYRPEAQSYHELRSQYLLITSGLAEAAGVVSRYVGGVYVDRSFTNQTAGNPAARPFTPVGLNDQKRAMGLLASQVFSPMALQAPADLYTYLQMQRRGFNFFNAGEDPKITDRVLEIQEGVLDHLLHPNTLKRITDSEIYGNRYKLSDLFSELTIAIFRDDLTTPVNSFRQNLQSEYVDRLVNMANLNPKKPSNVHYPAQSLALYQLRVIQKTLIKTVAADVATKAHRDFVLHKIGLSINGGHTVVKEVVERSEGAYGPVRKSFGGGSSHRKKKRRRH